MSNKIVILILGIPGAGKTTLANNLSNALAGIPHVDTDIIKAVYETTNPQIFSQTSHSAWALFGECTYENIIKGYTVLSREIFKKCIPLIQRLLKTYNTIIIEGLGIDIDKIEDLQIPTIVFYLTNQNKEEGYKNKMMYRNSGVNGWERDQSILQTIDTYMKQRLSKVPNVSFIEVSDGYDVKQLVKDIGVKLNTII